ncbi:SAM-dependent methlyltransferase [Methanoculleus sediminis]|uniref:SAM-dependent methlyltransferase n=1 Tax=Methanoculleus sediminis TaxID=1550566 RepID=A0A0H1QY53_9EURY|nr:class I SAM-dependent methyltransferase [Methanoculleus sediminis]KLK87835.1 SAM-dependent methlyltransferase [Methanoculleus sediminis]
MTYRETDWNAVWKELYDVNACCRGGDCGSNWESRERALAFLKQSRENPIRIRHVIRGLPVGPGARVLDIGAGPGTLAVPLAGVAAHVTAVEPATGMAGVMAEYAAESGVSNLTIVRKRWEDVDPAADLEGHYDVVVASYSLGMPDIRAAIEKMCEASSRWVYLFWFAGTTSWEQAMIDLWPQLHGREYQRGPKADVLFNVLYSMGICPNVETSRLEHVRRFPDLEAAVAEFREQYGVTIPRQEATLRDYLAGTLSENGGDLLLSGMTTRVKLWWEVTGAGE